MFSWPEGGAYSNSLTKISMHLGAAQASSALPLDPPPVMLCMFADIPPSPPPTHTHTYTYIDYKKGKEMSNRWFSNKTPRCWLVLYYVCCSLSYVINYLRLWDSAPPTHINYLTFIPWWSM